MIERRLQRKRARQRRQRLGTLVVSVVLAFMLTLFMVQALAAQDEGQPAPPQLSSDAAGDEIKDTIGAPADAALELDKTVD